MKETWDPRYSAIAQRLRALWSDESYRSVEERLKVPRGWAYDLVHGRKKLALDLAVNICQVWKCSLSWLVDLGDEGDSIPIVGFASGGTATNPAELEITQLNGTEAVRYSGCEAVIVVGESMRPLADHGQKVIVGPSGTVADNCPAFIALSDGRRMIKRVTRTDDGRAYILTSINVADSSSAPIVVRRNDVEEIREVVGVDMRKVPGAVTKERRARREMVVTNFTETRRLLLAVRAEMLDSLREALFETGMVARADALSGTLAQIGQRLRGEHKFDGILLDGFLGGFGPSIILEELSLAGSKLPLAICCELAEVEQIYRQKYKIPFSFATFPLTVDTASALLEKMFPGA